MKKISLLIIILLNISNPTFAMERTEQIVAQLIPEKEMAFTEKNVDKHPQYKDYFVKYALDNFLTLFEKNEFTDTSFFSAFNKLIKKYPEEIVLFVNKVIANWPDPKNFKDWRSFHTIQSRLMTILLNSDEKSIESLIKKVIDDDRDPNNQILRYIIETIEREAKSPLANESYFRKEIENAKKTILILRKLLNQINLDILLKNMDLRKIDLLYPYFEKEKQQIIRDYILKNKVSDIFPLVTKINIELFPEFKDIFIKYTFDNFEKLLTKDYNYNVVSFMDTLIQKYPETTQLFLSITRNNSNIYKGRFIKNLFNQNKTKEAVALFLEQKFNNVNVGDFASYISHLKNYIFTDKYEEFKKEVIKYILENPTKISNSNLQYIYEYREFLSYADKKELKNKLLKYYENFKLPEPLTLKNLLLFTLTNQTPPAFVLKLEPKLSTGTQSKLHFITSLIRNAEPLKLNKNDIDFFLKIYTQEKNEESNGHYVFFHGRQWKWNYYSDIYKQLWNLTRNDYVGDSFQFLRFGEPGPKREENKDILFMNSAIFGNLTNAGSNTAKYWLDNIDQSGNKDIAFLNTGYLFKQFNLEDIYKKYEKEFKQLQELHAQASKKGEILLISVSPEKTIDVIPTKSGGSITAVNINPKLTTNTKEILDILKTAPEEIENADRLEWGLIMGMWDKNGSYIPNPYANDPHNGLIIYSFYEADPKIMDQYFKLRDELFAKIKQDLKQVKKVESGQIRSSL